MGEKYYKSTFERIPEEKQEWILSVATEEFASKGFNSTNINVIAQKAGISVGSLYKYFETKEHFFLAVVERGVDQLEKSLGTVISQDTSDVFDKIDLILEITRDHARTHSALHRLYNEMTSESNADLTDRLSVRMESVSAQIYTQLIEQAMASGVVASDIDARIFAYCLDNIFMIYQFSYSTDYYKQRMKTYIGEDVFDRDEDVVREISKFIRRAFRS